jgi:predicted outer membrane protein
LLRAQREKRRQPDAGSCANWPRCTIEVHQFDLFQQSITDSSDKRGDDAVRKSASAQSEAAEKRDKQLTSLARKTALNVEFPDEPSATRNNRLSGLDGLVGEAYVRGFYAAEISEHQTMISLFKRYSVAPDNNDILAFAQSQLPVLEAELAKAQQASLR